MHAIHSRQHMHERTCTHRHADKRRHRCHGHRHHSDSHGIVPESNDEHTCDMRRWHPFKPIQKSNYSPPKTHFTWKLLEVNPVVDLTRDRPKVPNLKPWIHGMRNVLECSQSVHPYTSLAWLVTHTTSRPRGSARRAGLHSAWSRGALAPVG